MKIMPAIASAALAVGISTFTLGAAPSAVASTVTDPTTIPDTTTTTSTTTTTTTTTTTIAPTTSEETLPAQDDEPDPTTTAVAAPTTTIPGSGDPDPTNVLPETGSGTEMAMYAFGMLALGVAAIAVSRRRIRFD